MRPTGPDLNPNQGRRASKCSGIHQPCTNRRARVRVRVLLLVKQCIPARVELGGQLGFSSRPLLLQLAARNKLVRPSPDQIILGGTRFFRQLAQPHTILSLLHRRRAIQLHHGFSRAAAWCRMLDAVKVGRLCQRQEVGAGHELAEERRSWQRELLSRPAEGGRQDRSGV